MYYIYDLVAEEASAPMLQKNDSVALRIFDSLVDENHLDPKDYKLYCFGEYDTEGPKYSVLSTPEEISYKELKLEDVQAYHRMEEELKKDGE